MEEEEKGKEEEGEGRGGEGATWWGEVGGTQGREPRRRKRNVETDTFLFSPPLPPSISPTPCIFLGDLICLSERENQFMMTIGGPVMKAAQFLRHGKVSPANLGKMNHSHFIWTSVLTPPSPSPPPPTSLTPLPHPHPPPSTPAPTLIHL